MNAGNISEGIYELLMAQGLKAGSRAGTRMLARKVARTAGTGAARKGAGLPGRDQTDPRTAGGGFQPMGMGKKDRGDETPASVRALRLVASDSSRRRTASTATLRLMPI